MNLNIKQLREELKLSQSEFAEKLGVHPTAVSKWENGKAQPKISYIRKIEELFLSNESNVYTSIIDENLGIDKKRMIEGEWLTTWSYKDKTGDVRNDDILTIHSNGLIVEGEGKNNDFNYRIVGHLTVDGFLSGKWFSILNESVHHGVFLLKIDPGGRSGNGNWLGTYIDGQPIMNGSWIWKKRSNI